MWARRNANFPEEGAPGDEAEDDGDRHGALAAAIDGGECRGLTE
jgi:hypothetical protein